MCTSLHASPLAPLATQLGRHTAAGRLAMPRAKLLGCMVVKSSAIKMKLRDGCCGRGQYRRDGALRKACTCRKAALAAGATATAERQM